MRRPQTILFFFLFTLASCTSLVKDVNNLFSPSPSPCSTATATLIPTAAATAIEVVVQENLLYRELSPAEMESMDMHGYGIEVTTEVEGLTTRYYMVTADSLIEVLKRNGFGPVILNPEMADPTLDLNAAERIGRMLRIADYLGYIQDTGLTEEAYPFNNYIEDLKKGEDKSYSIYCLKEKTQVDPHKNHELIFVYDLDFTNGFFNIKSGIYSQMGFLITKNGNLRMFIVLTEPIVSGNIERSLNDLFLEEEIKERYFAYMLGDTLKISLLFLGVEDEIQQGKGTTAGREIIDMVYESPSNSLEGEELMRLNLSPFVDADYKWAFRYIQALHNEKPEK